MKKPTALLRNAVYGLLVSSGIIAQVAYSSLAVANQLPNMSESDRALLNRRAATFTPSSERLLQKVEELTLHASAQEQRIQRLEQENSG